MLPRHQKLSRKSFPAHNEPKKTWRGRVLFFRYTQTAEKRPARIAVVLSKKIFATAVERNRIRRSLYRILRQYTDKQEYFLGTKIVITLQRGLVYSDDVFSSDVSAFFLQKV